MLLQALGFPRHSHNDISPPAVQQTQNVSSSTVVSSGWDVPEAKGKKKKEDKNRRKRENRGYQEHFMLCVYVHTCVAVMGRNRTLFRCVFRLHCCVRSYALGKLINTSHVYTAHMSPAPNGSSTLQRFEHSDAIKMGITFDFYPGLPHMYRRKCVTEFECFLVYTG